MTTVPARLSSDRLVAGSLPPGTRLAGRYRVRDKVGEGATASVYRAHDEIDDSTVALKVFTSLTSTDPVARARFERELTLLTRLSHPRIARSFGADRHEDLEFLVLEFIPGPTLRQRLSRGPVPIDEAIVISQQLCEALIVCHSEGVLHRDLKPSNIVLHPDRGAIVIDFGVAWFSAAATLTRTGAVVGSPRYVAPEVLRSSIADARSDIYAVGVILSEMLAGRPDAGDDNNAPKGRAEIADDLDRVIGCARAPLAHQRYATAEELLNALRQPTAGQWGRRRWAPAQSKCPSCSTHRIVDLPFCPGCGRPVSWQLTKGPFAVQLDGIRDVDATARWLMQRFGPRLVPDSRPRLIQRLRFQPVPLAIGISRGSAEQLAAEARREGLDTAVVRTHALFGPRLTASQASAVDFAYALGWHFSVTMSLGVVLHLLGWTTTWLSALPAWVALAAISAFWVFGRRPLLSADAVAPEVSLPPPIGSLPSILATLANDRSRHLATQALARSVPVLLDPLADDSLKEEVTGRLMAAVEAVARADVHRRYLLDHPRHALMRATAAAHRAAAVPTRNGELDRQSSDDLPSAIVEKTRALTEVALAYDLEVATALEHCQHISTLAGTTATTADLTWPR